MLDALLAAVVVAVLVALALAVLYAVTVLPFLLTVGAAERRGLSTGRWSAVSLAAVLLALALALLAERAGVGRPLQLAALLVGFAPLPVVTSGVLPGGRAGRHESPV